MMRPEKGSVLMPVNECLNKLRPVVSDDYLKTISFGGYFLTPDTTTDEFVKLSNTRTATSIDQGRRLIPAMLQELMFNSQWVISRYQRSPRVWIGIGVLAAVVLLSSAGTTASATTGHMAYDRTDGNVCFNRFGICAACIPSLWQTSASYAHSNWFLPNGCNPG